MNPNFSKVILGTAQLGMPYGLGAWKTEMMPEATAFSILDVAWDLGLTTLDTSSNYGVAEERIAKFMRLNPSKSFNVISKVKSQNTDTRQEVSFFESWLKKSPLFDVGSLSILLHNENDIRSEVVVDSMERYQSRGVFASWGVSLYSAELAALAAEIQQCQIIQLPFGILNQSFHTDGILDILCQHNKIIHARSVFTQGLLFANELNSHGTSNEVLETIKVLSDLANRKRLTLTQCAMSFVLSFDEINSIVIGVDTPQQLNEIIGCVESPDKEFVSGILSDHIEGLAPDDVRPERWK